MNSGRKRRLLVVVLTVFTLLLSLACNAFQSTTEAPTQEPPTATSQPTEQPPTEVPPTDTPQPTSEPTPSGLTVEIINDTDKEIWYVYISPTDAEEWGQDWLGDATIAPGERYVIEGVLKGLYDLQARDVDDNVIQTLWDWEIAGSTTWNVISEVTLEVFNNTEEVITI